MKIAFGCDHAGFQLKKKLINSINDEYEDFGTYDETSVDYPDFGIKVAKKVAEGEFNFGVLICGTGIGMSIVANKVAGIRAALCCNTMTAKLCREHNDANVLVLGAKVVTPELAKEVLKVFLETAFSNEQRHICRLNKIKELEEARRFESTI
ncbi:MAG: ribose 5-phosphate isomerase B [bacterium]|nr:ribose 5-phosphate isomerase B [bacterium]